MAKKVFYTDVDLNGNKLMNGRLEELPTAPTPLGVGHVYFDTTLNSIGAWDGTVWVYNSSSGGIISVTYTQLTALIGASGLIVGQKYLLTDFATSHIIPSTLVVNTGTTEPLIVEANSINTIYANAISTLFPKDELLYEAVDTSTAGGDKGRIYYRKDTINNNSTWYDWRVVLFRRWETFNASGVFAIMGDNGGSFQDLFTFNNSASASGCYGNSIGSIGDALSIPDGLNNIVFNCIAINNTLGKDCWICNFVGGECRNNVIGDNFNGNYIYGAFGYNNIGQQCNQNTFGGDVNYNNIGTYFSTNSTGVFSSNIIADNFYFNSFADAFSYNKVGSFCQDNSFGGETVLNVIGDNFMTNVLNTTFYQNIISDNFSFNDLGSFVSNTVDSYFSANTVSGACNFHYNFIGDSFSTNTITGNEPFQFNKIGANCNTNSFDVTTAPFEYNVAGDVFSSNNFFGTTQGNTMSSSFTGNVCNGIFSNNTIGVGMNANTLGSDFSNNTIGNGFFLNDMGINCHDNVFKNGVNRLIALDDFNNNVIDNDFNTVDFSSATLVYSTAPKYNKNITRRSDGAYTLWYIDGSDIMTFASPIA